MNDVHLTWYGGVWLGPLAVVAVAFAGLILWNYRATSAYARARFMAAGCKYLGVLLLLICLLEPRMHGQRPTQGANSVAILIDNSRSMKLHGRGVPAANEMADWLGSNDAGWRKQLAEDFDVHLFAFDRDLREVKDPKTLDFGGEFSNVHAAVSALQKQTLERPLAAIILVTDGNATDVALDGQSSDQTVPVFPILEAVGSPLQDLRVQQATVTQTPFESSPVSVQAEVISQGGDHATLLAQLMDEQGNVVAEQEIADAKEGKATPVQFRFRPTDLGTLFYRLRVGKSKSNEGLVTSDGEATLENNERTLLIDRAGGPFRVLYVAGRPNWEFKFLRRAVSEDPELKLDGLLRIANKQPKFLFNDRRGADGSNPLFEGFDKEDPEDVEAHDEPVFKRILAEEGTTELAKGFPATPEDLFAYHGMIVDDTESAFFTPDQQELIRKAVGQRGAGLLMLGGINSFSEGGYHRTPVGEMLPVYLSADAQTARESTVMSSEDPDRRRWQLTREGWLEPWVRLRATEAEEQTRLDQMPGFQVVNTTGAVKPGATMLAHLGGGSKHDVGLAVQRFGNGRVGAVTVGDLWRWEMQKPSPGSKELTVFWRQMLRWLVAQAPQRVQVNVEPSLSGTDPTRIRVQVRTADFQADDGATVKIVVQPPSGDELTLTANPDGDVAGSFLAEYWPTVQGGHRLRVQVATGDGQQLPERSTGWVVSPAEKEWDRLDPHREWLTDLAKRTGGAVSSPRQMTSLLAQIKAKPAPVMESWSAPWWHRPWIFMAALVLFCSEWALRRYRGLA